MRKCLVEHTEVEAKAEAAKVAVEPDAGVAKAAPVVSEAEARVAVAEVAVASVPAATAFARVAARPPLTRQDYRATRSSVPSAAPP